MTPTTHASERRGDGRDVLIARVHDYLVRTSMPRLVMITVVGGAGLAAFVASALMLKMGIESMAVRYGFACLAGYAAFAGCIRIWITVRRRQTSHVLETMGDFASDAGFHLASAALDSATSVRPVPPTPFGGGRTGGGGASGAWSGRGGPVEPAAPVSGDGGLGAVSLDLDDGWWLVAAAALAVGGLAAVGYVVYVAPVLLAEVALDAALVSAVYRRLKARDAGHWLGAVWRRTWLPALALTVFMAGAGFAVQTALPDARSIGDVVRWIAG